MSETTNKPMCQSKMSSLCSGNVPATMIATLNETASSLYEGREQILLCQSCAEMHLLGCVQDIRPIDFGDIASGKIAELAGSPGNKESEAGDG